MAIFQPSNITPSSFAGIGLGVVDVNDNVEISWQVNGNSPMTAFQIQIYNNATPQNITVIKDTGIISDGIPTGGFYGVDNKGNPKQFTYSPNESWATWGSLSNGNQYKMVITQYWGNNNSQSITEWSGSVFLTRTTPTLILQYNNSNYDGSIPIENAIATFTAVYEQAQSDSINSVRWQLRNSQSQILEDTGFINTSELSYTYNKFFTNNNYSINCTVETQNGVQVSTNWITFVVSYPLATSTGELNLECMNDNSVLVSWQQALDIPGTLSSGELNINNGVLTLDDGQSVTWDNVNNETMNFEPYWFLSMKQDIWRKNDFSIECDESFVVSPNKKILVCFDFSKPATIYDIVNNEIIFRSELRSALLGAFSNDGSYFVLIYGASFYVYKVDANGNFTYLTETVYDNNDSLYTASITFSPTNNYFVLCTRTRRIYTECPCLVYRIENNDSVTSFGSLTQPNTSALYEERYAISATFSNDGLSLFLSCGESLHLYQYTIDNNSTANNWSYQLIYENTSATIHTTSLMTSKNVLIGASGKGANTANASLYLYIYTENNGVWGLSSITNISRSLSGFYDTLLAISNDGNTLVCCDGRYFEFFKVGTNSLTSIKSGTNANTITGFGFLDNNTILTSTNNIVSLIKSNLTGFNINQVTVFDNLPPYFWFAQSQNGTIGLNSDGLVQIENAQSNISSIDTINSIQLIGPKEIDYLYITSNNNVEETFNNTKLVWDSQTLFWANFSNDGLQAGTLSTSGDVSNYLYRFENNEFQFIAEFPTAITEFRDYTIKSGKVYSYELFYVSVNSGFSSPTQSVEMCRQFKKYSLLEAVQDSQNPNLYYLVKEWEFGNNISIGSISNNNTPNWLTNFTPYRLRQPSSRMGKSGTLQALLSNYNSDQNFYADTVEMMNTLYQASQSSNTFFLKDLKGNLYMVGISAPISQDIETKSKVRQVKISLSWEEIGSTKDISIIYIPSLNSGDDLIANSSTNLVANTPSDESEVKLSINNGSVIAQ